MKQLIAGNWKMNLNGGQAVELVNSLHLESPGEVLLCPPFPYLQQVKNAIGDRPIHLGGQDCHHADSGAHTGDVSGQMLVGVGCSYVILGHSERRREHHETSYVVSYKAMAAARAGLRVIVCVGETDAENQEGLTQSVLKTQLEESIPDGFSSHSLCIAYEPVWAIGTGRTALPEEIVDAHDYIRSCLQSLCEDPSEVRILYGGSVNAKNAAHILALPNVNGVLVGGAALKADEFNQIIQAAR